MSLPYSGAPESQAPPVPIYVGLDLSLTSTGRVMIHGDHVALDRIRSKPTAGDTGSLAARLDLIVNEIIGEIPLADHTHVAIEGPAFGANDRGAHIRGGLWWLVRRELHREGIDTVVISPASVKKYATGRGNAQKDIVLAAVIRRYPTFDVTGNDIADALVLAAMAARHDGHPIESSLPEVHLAAMTGVAR